VRIGSLVAFSPPACEASSSHHRPIAPPPPSQPVSAPRAPLTRHFADAQCRRPAPSPQLSLSTLPHFCPNPQPRAHKPCTPPATNTCKLKPLHPNPRPAVSCTPCADASCAFHLTPRRLLPASSRQMPAAAPYKKPCVCSASPPPPAFCFTPPRPQAERASARGSKPPPYPSTNRQRVTAPARASGSRGAPPTSRPEKSDLPMALHTDKPIHCHDTPLVSANLSPSENTHTPRLVSATHLKNTVDPTHATPNHQALPSPRPANFSLGGRCLSSTLRLRPEGSLRRPGTNDS
jgi:hypothetical protein